MRYDDPEVARKILNSYKRWAVVGLSNDPSRASFRVARYLINEGFEIIPVNPNQQACQGLDCYPDLASAARDHEIEVVDLFRRSEFVAGHVDEAIAIGASAVWGQLGVIDEDAAERAAAASLDVVMDRCPAIDGPSMLGTP